MRKLLVAALLAVSGAVPAQAAFIQFDFKAFGNGDITYFDIESTELPVTVYGSANGYFTIIVDEDFPHLLGQHEAHLYTEGSSIYASSEWKGYSVESITVNALFSDGLFEDGFPLLDEERPISGQMVITFSGKGSPYGGFSGAITSVSSRYVDAVGPSAWGGFSIVSPPVPEPATWAMMIGGFALAGAAMRRRSYRVAFG